MFAKKLKAGGPVETGNLSSLLFLALNMFSFSPPNLTFPNFQQSKSAVSPYPNDRGVNPSEFRDCFRKMATGRVDLDGNPIKPMTICMIGAGGFIGSHLCEKLMEETPHKVLAVDVYNDKIKHLLEPSSQWGDRIQFHRLNIKNDSRLEGLIRMADLVISLASSAFCAFLLLVFLHVSNINVALLWIL